MQGGTACIYCEKDGIPCKVKEAKFQAALDGQDDWFVGIRKPSHHELLVKQTQ